MLHRQAERRVLSLLLAALVLTLTTLACGETDSPAHEEPSSETLTQEATASPRLTSTPAPTVDISDCTLGATFQADVTIPDNTQIELGQSFVKTWRIRNTGTCDWQVGYRFAFADGEAMSGPDAVEVPETPAGESAEISVELVAPMEDGQYRSYWQMCVNESDCFGDRVYVQIISFDPSKPTPTTPPVIQPTQPPAAPVCECSYDAYNCSSFSSTRQAQACYNYCREQGRGDIHRLDRDNDGRACE
jgi:hypothetical protein